MGSGKKKSKEKEKKQLPNINNLEDVNMFIDFDKLVKNEYQRLLRQYRLMEDERHSVAAKGNALSKQAKLLDILYEELKDLKTDLYNVDCDRNTQIDKKSHDTILELIEGYEQANQEQAFCLKNIREITNHVDRIVKYLVDHKLKVQAIYGNSKTVAHFEKRRRILENRLYYYTTKFCLKIAENKVVRREDINLSLKLRGLFHRRHLGLKHQLQDIRIKMGDVVFLATDAYDQRDDLVVAVRNIRERNDKDNRQHILEMKEFNRILQADSIMRGFLRKKSVNRNIFESEKQRSNRKNLSRMRNMERQLLLYVKNFNTILSKSSSATMEVLVRNYNEMMQQNFGMFRYNADLSEEVIFLRTETLNMSTEIENLHAEAEKRKADHKLELKAARSQREYLNRELDVLRVMLTKTEINMEEVLQTLDTIFNFVGCSRGSFARFLGNRIGTQANNAIFCVSLIEAQARELIRKKQELETRRQIMSRMKDGGRPLHPEGGPKGIAVCAGGPFAPTLTVSTHLEDGDDEEEDHGSLRPFYHKETKDALLERLKNRKENSGVAAMFTPKGRESLSHSTSRVSSTALDMGRNGEDDRDT